MKNSNTYSSTKNAISVINGNMRKNQGASADNAQNHELAGNQFHKTYMPNMDFKVQFQTGPLTLGDFSHYDLGTYNYYQHQNNDNLDYYTRLENYTETKIDAHTRYVYFSDNFCHTNYSGPVIIDVDEEISLSSFHGNELESKEAEYHDIVDRGNTAYLISLAENMNTPNFLTAYPILCNDGYLSDAVFEAIVNNHTAPRPKIAAILIQNSPLPDNILKMANNSTYLKNGHKKQIRKVQSGTNPRLLLEYEMADIKQEISRIESNMTNHAINNDTGPSVREKVIDYFANIAETNTENFINRFDLQMAKAEHTEAENTLSALRNYAANLQDDSIAMEIQQYCDVNDVYLSAIQDSIFDKTVLEQNQAFLRQAALDCSPLYSGKAQTLYEIATDSMFIEYTPLPLDEMGTKSMVQESSDEDIIKPELKVYPNPTDGLLYVKYDFTPVNDTYDDLLLDIMGVDAEPNCTQGKISIYSNDGQLVKTLSLNKTKGMKSINMQNYKPASYMVEITDCYGFTNSVKIVKQ